MDRRRVLFCFVATLCLVVAQDEYKSIEELITQHGFKFEELQIRTPDGYICRVHRLQAPGGATKGPVLLQHGLFDSSDSWVLNYRDRALGFILADEGFDVFLGNSRGNKYCSEHETLSASDSEFWDFSWDDMAEFDQPAFIDEILQLTSQDSLAYVGHSQGTTQMFAALVTQPEMKKKVNLFVALAPVTYIANTRSPLLVAAAKLGVDRLVSALGIRQFMPTSSFMRTLLPWVCTNFLFEWMCDSVMYFGIGYNKEEMQTDRMSVYLSHFPSGTSTKDLVHWAQGVRNFDGDRSDFSQFDYGKQNIEKYGTAQPPIYNITNFPHSEIELLVFSGGVDQLSSPNDVDRMISHLPERPKLWKRLEHYDHLDFIWGANAHNDIYHTVVEHMNTAWVKKSGQQAAGSGLRWSFNVEMVAVGVAVSVGATLFSVLTVVGYRKRRVISHALQLTRSPKKERELHQSLI